MENNSSDKSFKSPEKALKDEIFKSLEQVLREGVLDKGKKRQLTLPRNTVPTFIPGTILRLYRQQNKSSYEVINAMMGLGLKVIETRFSAQIQEIAKLQPDHELASLLSRASPFRFQNILLNPDPYDQSIACDQATAVRIKLRKPLHLSNATAICLVLLAGIAQSESSIPQAWVKLAQAELNDFQLYLNKQINSLVSKNS